ncbi:hypothetical protein T11_16768 [Trichinella zimbabwensis]|uniref:Uncharacterized protein n=1 Tax=Trichinella zimbabwensis TaxID=268475 RepID=A0A0V1GT61_9BILA|nr:hypothetical protein T11_16768 [Trichinella zimbabwensis]
MVTLESTLLPPARSSFYEGFSQRSQSGLHCCRGDNLSWYEVIASRLTSLNPASYAVGERVKSTLMFKATNIESADCLWSHYERIFVQALNYLVIPEIQNTSTLLPSSQSSFNEGLSQQSQSVYTAATVKVATKSSPAVSQSCILRGCFYEVAEAVDRVSMEAADQVSIETVDQVSIPSLNQATPQAMPQAIFQNFRIFRNFSPRRRPRLRLRA